MPYIEQADWEVTEVIPQAYRIMVSTSGIHSEIILLAYTMKVTILAQLYPVRWLMATV
jgi:hypothetical protein